MISVFFIQMIINIKYKLKIENYYYEKKEIENL